MAKFQIGDFLTVEGPELDLREWRSGRVARFSRLVLTDGQHTVTLAADPTSPVPRPRIGGEFPEPSMLEFPVPTESVDVPPDGIRIELKVNAEAELRFISPNPLSHFSRGYGLRLTIVRRPAGYQLRYGGGPPRSALAVCTDPSKPPHNAWLIGPIANHDDGGLSVWVDAWRARPPSFRLNRAQVDGCVLLSPADESATLIRARLPEPPAHTLPTLTLRLAPVGGVTTLISELFQGATVSVPLSSAALRLDELASIRTSSLQWRRDWDLRSFAVLFPWTLGAPTWLVDWHGVPGLSQPEEADLLSVRTLWHGLASHYGLGIQSTRSRRLLSFVPTDLWTPNGAPPWVARFAVTRPRDRWRTRLAELGLPASGAEPTISHLRLTLGLATRVDGTAAAIAAQGRTRHFRVPGDAWKAGEAWTSRPEKLLRLEAWGSQAEIGSLLIGNVLLDVGSMPPLGAQISSLDVDLAPASANLGRAPLEVRWLLRADARFPKPGGEDPEAGFTTDPPQIRRERPLVVDLGSASGAVRLEVQEDASPETSRLLQLRLHAVSSQSVRSDVVVLDANPFFVGRVRGEATKVAQDRDLVAIFRIDDERPAGWQFLTETGAMEMILPPQAIGEEMIKGNLKLADGTAVPLVDRPFDFRLGRPALLELDRSDVDTARTPPPWTVRRLLDRREGVVGMRLDSATFELLYGLETSIAKPREETSRLRIAEQAAFVGEIPFASDVQRAAESDERDQEFETNQRTYANVFADWIKSVQHRHAHIPVFRDFTERTRIAIAEDVTFALRAARQTAHPFQIDDPAVPIDQIEKGDRDRKPLRGGVDFGFESKNIYTAVVETPKGSGVITGLAFGPLGGSGGQEAAFDDGRTRIISETTQGRLSSLTIIRTGRISMLWNLARHVIVYERTVRRPPRYVEEQPGEFENLAALRKVREYVEITQRRRNYPDADGDVRATGPLTGSFFETTIIPVKTSWGRDVEGGWMIALAGPVSDKEAPFYPRPKIFLELARALGKGEGHVNHLVTTPERLHFFTSTRRGDGGESDRWPAWPDIDFPMTAKPPPPSLPFLPAFDGAARQADAPASDFGWQRFTVEVAPAEEGVNLLHGRPSEGLEARVRSVSLQRGRPATLPPSGIDVAVARTFAEAEARVADALAELDGHLSRVLAERGDVAISAIEGLHRQARGLVERAQKDVGEIEKALERGRPSLEANLETWGRSQAESIRLAQEQLAAQLKGSDHHSWVAQLEGAFAAAEERLSDGGAKSEVEASARLAIDGLQRQVVAALDTFAFVAERARGQLEGAIGALQGAVESRLETARAVWRALVDALALRFATEPPRLLEAELIATLLATQQAFLRLESDARRLAKDVLGALFGDPPDVGKRGAVGALTEAIQLVAVAVIAWIDDTVEEIPPFDLEEPDWDALKQALDDTIVEVEPFFAEVKKELLDVLDQALDRKGSWRPLRKQVIDDFEKLTTEAKKAAKDAVESLASFRAFIAKVPSDMETAARDAVTRLAKAAPDVLTAIKNTPPLGDLEGEASLTVDALRNEIDKLAAELDSAAPRLAKLAEAVHDTADRGRGILSVVADKIERAVVRELCPPNVLPTGGNVLDVARVLAEGPVTDSLLCTRDWVGYYLDPLRDALDVTRSGAIFNDPGIGALNPMSAQIPFDRIRDRVLPRLEDFDLKSLFPDFAGLKLEHLLAGLDIPSDPFGEYDWIKVKHGFDQSRLTAWTDVAVDKQFEENAQIFEFAPVAVDVVRPRFRSSSRVEASKEAGTRAQFTDAALTADWRITIGGEPIVTIEDTALRYDSGGGLRFDLSPDKIQLAPALQFITDALAALLPAGDGVTIGPAVPGGVTVSLDLPLPDITTGAFTLTGITLHSHFDLLVLGGFEIRTGLWLSKPDRPFGLAILFLGGGGWFGVDVRYRPPSEFETRVSAGLSAGAFVALNLTVARGSAGILLTAGIDFYRDWLSGSTGELAISIGLLAWGEFSILGIASAYLRIVFRIEYRNGNLTGYGRVSLSIRICWCFTLRVNHSVTIRFAGSGGRSESLAHGARGAISIARSALMAATPTIREAVLAHFQNLDWWEHDS